MLALCCIADCLLGRGLITFEVQFLKVMAPVTTLTCTVVPEHFLGQSQRLLENHQALMMIVLEYI